MPERPLAPARRTGPLAAVPRIAALVLATVSAVSALTALSTGVRQALAPLQVPFDLLLVNAAPNLTSAAVFAVLAGAAARRKRVAWWGVVVLASLELLGGVSVVLALWFAPPDTLDPETLAQVPGRPLATVLIVLQAAAFGVFLAARRHFPTRVRRRSALRALAVLLAGLAVISLIGFALVSLMPGTLATTGDRVVWTLSEVTGTQFAGDIPGFGSAPRPVDLTLGFLGLVTVLTALLVLTRPQRAASDLAPESERQVRDLLAVHGDQDSLSYFATRRDKAAIFAPSGKAAVTYRVVAGVSLASADPVGDPDHWAPAIERWLDEARTYAWVPAVMGASEAGARAYHRAGLKVLEIGDEAVVHVARFDLEHPDLRPVRQVVQRLSGPGTRCASAVTARSPAQEMEQLVALADGWRHGETERGFSMALSRLGDPADAACVAVEALDPAGRPVALLSFVPWGSRRALPRPDAPRAGRRQRPHRAHGRRARRPRARARGRPAVAQLRGVQVRVRGRRQDRRGPGGAAWRRLLLVASRWWQLESLYRSNVKYRPEWVPRFLCFADRRELVEISFASALAEGFLLLPGSSRSLATAGGGDAGPDARPTRRRRRGRRWSRTRRRPGGRGRRGGRRGAPPAGAGPLRHPRAAARRRLDLSRDVPPHPHLRRGPRSSTRACGPGTAQARWRASPGGSSPSATMAGCASRCCGTGPGTCRCSSRARVSGRTGWTGFCATSTSATTSASPAKWSPRAAASCPWPPQSGP